MIEDVDAVRERKCKEGEGFGRQIGGKKKRKKNPDWCEMFSAKEEFVTLQDRMSTLSRVAQQDVLKDLR